VPLNGRKVTFPGLRALDRVKAPVHALRAALEGLVWCSGPQKRLGGGLYGR